MAPFSTLATKNRAYDTLSLAFLVYRANENRKRCVLLSEVTQFTRFLCSLALRLIFHDIVLSCYVVLTTSQSVHEMFGIQLYKNNLCTYKYI
jgi:hypothetical protein